MCQTDFIEIQVCLCQCDTVNIYKFYILTSAKMYKSQKGKIKHLNNNLGQWLNQLQNAFPAYFTVV